MAGLKGRIIAGGLWLAGARGVINLLGFVGTVVLARLLVPADFGLVALGTSFMAIVVAVTEMSMAQALVHHRDPQEDHLHSAWTLNVLRGLALAAIMSLAARPMAWIYHEPRLEHVVFAFAVSVLVSGLVNPRQVTLVKELVFWQQFVLSVSQSLVTLVVSLIVAVIWRNYWALVAGVLAGQMVQVFLSYALLPFMPRVRLNRASELFSFSLWLTLGNAVNTLNWRSDQLLVGGIIGRTTLGYYTVGDNLAQIPTRETVGPLRDTLFPALSRLKDEPARLRGGYQDAQALITFLALPVGVGFALVAQPAVLATMGAKWLPAVPVIQALSAVFALQTLGSMVRPLGMAMGETRELFHRDLIMFFVRVPVVVLATIFLGLPGLILSRVFTGLVSMGVNVTFVRRLIDIPILEQFRVNWRSLGAALAMAAGVTAYHDTVARQAIGDGWSALLLVIQLVPLGAALYLGTALIMWLIARQPEGPECEVLAMVRAALGKARGGRLSGARPGK